MKNKFMGKVQEIKGKVTGDKAEELKGKARQKLGDAEQAVDRLKDRAQRREPGRSDRGVLDDETPESS